MKKFIIILVILFFSCESNETQNLTVGIQPYKGFSKIKTDTIARTIAAFYGVNIIVLPEKELPDEAFTNYKAPRYRADSIIRIQRRTSTKTTDYILGLTASDVCITKYDKNGEVRKPVHKYTDFGIMGLAFCPGTSAVVSSYRLQHGSSKVYFSRLKKVSVHEFGHNLGLPHCSDKKCVMTDAVESIKSIDNAKLALCKKCRDKI